MKVQASKRHSQLRLTRETLQRLEQPRLRTIAAGLTLTCFRSCGGAHTCFC
jgi:hypothetical protein